MTRDRLTVTGDDEQRAMAALRHVARHTVTPEIDRSREAQLLAAFDAAPRLRRSAAWWWWASGLATATAALIVIGALPNDARSARSLSGSLITASQARPAVQPPREAAVGDFVAWPGSVGLPPLESGELVRVELPVSVLPTLGLRPPASHKSAVTADLLVGQDGLTRAVRLVN
jgi:hypothetical protein